MNVEFTHKTHTAMKREQKCRLLEKRLSEILFTPGYFESSTWSDDMRLFYFGHELGDPGYCLVQRKTKPGEVEYTFKWISYAERFDRDDVERWLCDQELPA